MERSSFFPISLFRKIHWRNQHAPAPFRFFELDRSSWLMLFAGIALSGVVTLLL
jgi:hypothetical protein